MSNNVKFKKDYRKNYIYILIVIIVIAWILNTVFNFTEKPGDTLSYIANISELYGLIIALTEIFLLRNLTERLKSSIKSLNSFSDITNASEYLSRIADDLGNKNYGKAYIRLETVRSIYQNNIALDILQNIESAERRNLNQINSLIGHLRAADSGDKNIFTTKNTAIHVEFLISLSEPISIIQNNLRNNIL